MRSAQEAIAFGPTILHYEEIKSNQGQSGRDVLDSLASSE